MKVILKRFKATILPIQPQDWFGWYLFVAPFIIWFSYQPNLQLLRLSSFNLEVSLVLLYAIGLAIVGLPMILRQRSELLRTPLLQAAGLFTAWSLLSVLWSSNQLRGLMVAGLTVVLYLDLAALYLKRQTVVTLLPTLKRCLFLMTGVMCIVAIVQFGAGIWLNYDVGKNFGLCLGCSAEQFGFVRPNALAIEPQFLGSLLLLPTLWAMVDFCKKPNYRVLLLIGFELLVLFLTMSRGAIYALSCGVLVVLVQNYRHWRQGIVLIVTGATVCLLGIVLQCVAVQLNPRISEDWRITSSKVVEQLTLNKIRLPWRKMVRSDSSRRPRFSGYVFESTNIRLNFSDQALAIWRSSYKNRLVGTGVGSFGTELAKRTHTTWTREIVQNEFIEILQERGLIGLGVLIVMLVLLACYFGWSWQVAVLLTYVLQYCFFSGLPNALHIYLLLAILFSAAAAKHLPKRLPQNM